MGPGGHLVSFWWTLVLGGSPTVPLQLALVGRPGTSHRPPCPCEHPPFPAWCPALCHPHNPILLITGHGVYPEPLQTVPTGLGLITHPQRRERPGLQPGRGLRVQAARPHRPPALSGALQAPWMAGAGRGGDGRPRTPVGAESPAHASVCVRSPARWGQAALAQFGPAPRT